MFKFSFRRYITVVLILFAYQLSIAQFTFTNNLRGRITPDMVVGGGGGTQGVAYLTSGNPDPVGAGWLRLNNSSTNQRGYFYIDKSFPSTLGVLIDFEYKMWRNAANTNSNYHGGDGFSVFLFNAAVPFQIGGYGGSLGYARLVDAQNVVVSEGLAGGYIGIGFDAYGNFGSNSEGKVGRIPMDANGDALVPNAVVLRGATTSTPATSNMYLAGVKVGDRSGTAATIRTRNEIDYNTSPFNETRPTDAQFYRRVQVEINPTGTGAYNIIIRWRRNITDVGFQQLISYTTTEVPPALLKLGFAASTGGAFNYHEIRNIMITTPGNLRIVKKADKDLLRSVTGSNPANQNQITYTIEVTNDTDAALTNVDFKDVVTDGAGNLVSGGTSGDFRITSITHGGLTNVSLPNPSTGTPLATNEIIGSFDIAAKETGRITVVGTLTKIPTGNILNNTASALPTDIVDQDLDNNTSVVSTPVIAENVDLTIQKTSRGSDCINYTSGNSYELRVVNMGTQSASYIRRGTNGQRIVVYKDVPTGFAYNDAATSTTYWDKLTETISGGTRYIYVARGDSSSSQTLNGSGSIMYNDFPIIYTIRPTSTTTTTFNDVATVEYRATVTGSGNANRYDGTNIELTANLPNNTNTQTLNATPSMPTVDNDIVYYCLGQIQALSATATAGNTLNWYTTQNGFKLVNAPIPVTITRGTFKYYVSQSNGVCEGPLKEITVIVRNCKMVTNPMLINKSRSL